MLQLHNSTTQTVYSLMDGMKHLWNPALLQSIDVPNYKKYKRSTEVDDSSFARLSTSSHQGGMEADTLGMTDQRLVGLLHQTCNTLVINTIWILQSFRILPSKRYSNKSDQIQIKVRVAQPLQKRPPPLSQVPQDSGISCTE